MLDASILNPGILDPENIAKTITNKSKAFLFLWQLTLLLRYDQSKAQNCSNSSTFDSVL